MLPHIEYVTATLKIPLAYTIQYDVNCKMSVLLQVGHLLCSNVVTHHDHQTLHHILCQKGRYTAIALCV